MATTYKNTNNCLLFFTAKNFLDAIDTIFQFRFVQSSENKWVLEFRPVAELIWQRKPISVALATNHIDYNKDDNNYFISNNENNIEEDVHILKLYKTLYQLLVDAQYPNCILSSTNDIISVSQIKLFVPYHFDNSKFPAWLKVPGQPTLRISNGGVKDNSAFIYLAFNNWKYVQILQRQATNKKRKLEPEETPESVPIEQQPVVPQEIVVEP
jgi:hypothetical protein